MNEKNEIVLYQQGNSVQLEVLLENETVWLTQAQMCMLFQRERTVISKHIRNIFAEGELQENVVCANFAHTTQHGAMEGKTQTSIVQLYNLDVIISVGYRVKSQQGTQFRIWATKTLRDYVLKGYAINQRFERLEHRVAETEKKIDFFVKTALPPVEGIFYDGQIFDAYNFVSDLIKSAKKSIILIDNYIDNSDLMLLSKRNNGITATIYTAQITPQLQLDLQRHNAQYQPIKVGLFTKSHDRFLFIDDVVYHIGASLKDLGKKWFAFSKMGLETEVLLQNII
ncbi:MAG: virulence RhuM family protein [Prevotellaceae bacterium]|nr:virulence RhuM family protein [Prevotellaceae bacterium]